MSENSKRMMLGDWDISNYIYFPSCGIGRNHPADGMEKPARLLPVPTFVGHPDIFVG
jgi:hypothetical protein